MHNLRTLTVVKTDIRRFTDRVQQMTAAELDAFLCEHRALIAGVFRRYAGSVVKEIGDSYLVTFDSSTNALLASIALQRELAVRGRGSEDQVVEVRIAVTAGDVLIQEGDIFGTPVNMVARVESLAPPGDIYFTEAVYQNLNHNEVACEYVGTFPLKGITEAVRIYRTTFRHQTRTIENAAVLFTYFLSAKFVASAELALVERVFDFWERAHREVTVAHEGVIRSVMGDLYVTTFDAPAGGVSAWLDLASLVQAFNDEDDCPCHVDVMAGLGVGDIRVFRSTSYGEAFNTASVCSEYGGKNSLTLPASVAATLPVELSDRMEARRAEPRNEAAIERAKERGLGELVAILPRASGGPLREG